METQTKTVLLTGSTDGVGRLVAQKLGAAGYLVLLHGRNVARAAEVKAAIEAAGGQALVYLADFASLDQVRTLAGTIAREHPRLDLLINNAGLGWGHMETQRKLSQNGHELIFAVNYLAPFLLTRLLLPGVQAARGRIVNVASIGQEPLDLTDLMLTRGYNGIRAYRQSKLALIMFTIDLAAELADSGVTVNALHPATFMATNLVQQIGVQPQSTVAQGAEAMLHLALAPELAGATGQFFNGLAPARALPQAYDPAARKRLGALSRELTGLAPSPAPG
ncbi:MAG: SDR family NAD(P)-dependent oxidoreductase [Deltaproteobacteria bacterium]|nr:SDR family NAD(P)-dependent oxidoreductase [Deltaproteobacteria bacterium]